LALPAIVVSSMLGASGPAAGASSGTANRPSDRPNFVVIMTDDQRPETLAKMPQTKKLLTDKGIDFTNSFVVNPECCPSRAATLTGEYSHNTGVYRDQPPHGGVATFVKNHDERSTIATWLNSAGYTTALMGKYLNGYKGTRIPQGWDTWDAFNVPHSGKGHYFDYELNINGKRTARQHDDHLHLRQRVPLGGAPSGRKADAVGGEHPRPVHLPLRPGHGKHGDHEREPDREHRYRADDRGRSRSERAARRRLQ